MYIAREIARGHGGDITVESNERDGTMVTVVLPRRTDVVAAVAGSGSDPGILPTPNRSVLIVEDEDDVRETLREALEGKKYRVATAANGKEALELLMGKLPLPDVVIFDLQMPVLDGVAMYRAMQLHPQLVVDPRHGVDGRSGEGAGGRARVAEAGPARTPPRRDRDLQHKAS